MGFKKDFIEDIFVELLKDESIIDMSNKYFLEMS